MAQEIERKFLVNDTDQNADWRGCDAVLMRQGYLSIDKHRTVRVRVTDRHAWLTVKGISVGAARDEFEYEIPVADGEAMLQLCEHSLIEKRRFKFKSGNITWEIDDFVGDNAGLVIAEVELEHESQPIQIPAWVGTEVTDDPRYFNASLALMPYRYWDT